LVDGGDLAGVAEVVGATGTQPVRSDGSSTSKWAGAGGGRLPFRRIKLSKGSATMPTLATGAPVSPGALVTAVSTRVI
jgi:hypothetical protein